MGTPRVFSGIQPTADSFHLGNYLGAVKQWVDLQESRDAIYCVVDLHAITVPYDPETLRRRTRVAAAQLIAAGLDPERCILFVQSQVQEHSELAWVLSCLTGFGEASRMTQFKDKSVKGGADQASVGLFTYPMLMAADILLYGVETVPVGDDQRQHLELARDLAIRFNKSYGETFVVPRAVTPPVAARVMDLQEPAAKMSKSAAPAAPGVLRLLDPPDLVRRKVARAVTDSGGGVIFDPVGKPGVANLLTILAACTGTTPAEAAAGLGTYSELKEAVTAAVIAVLDPLQQRYADICADPGIVMATARDGAAKAQELAAPTLARAKKAIGLLSP